MQLSQQVGALAAAIATAAVRWRLVVVVAMVLIAVFTGRYTADAVGINTDTADMLDESLPWRRAYRDFTAAFPWFRDNIVIVVDAATPDLADDAASRLAGALAAREDRFATVFHAGSLAFLRRNQLLFLDSAELDALATQLGGAQALLGQLADDPGLDRLLRLSSDILQQRASDVPAQAGDFLDAIAATIEDFLGGDRTPLAWSALLAGDVGSERTRAFIAVQPRLDYASPLPAADAIDAISAITRELGLDDEPGVRVRRTGAAALAHDELSSVIRGAEQAALAAAVMIAACLFVGLRSLGLVLATLLSLVIGLVMTAGFATAAVGTLNMISVAFAALYVGLGVDFAIHLCLRYRELCGQLPKREAITGAVQHIGPSLALCALTTAIAFFSFLPTAYRGVAELGLISGVGMGISLVISLTLLPALLALFPTPRPAHTMLEAGGAVTRHGTTVLIGASLLALAALTTLPAARFDINPLRLNDQAAESVKLFDDLATRSAESLYALSVIAPDAAAAHSLRERLAVDPTVSAALTADALVPAAQDDKLAIIDGLRWTLGPDLVVGEAAALEDDRAGLRARLRTAAGAADVPGAARLDAALGALDERLGALAPDRRVALLQDLERQLMRHFPAQVERLADALEAEAFGLDELPAELARRWIAADGRWRVEIQPADDLDRRAEVVRFVDSVRAVTGPAATGIPVINLEASDAVTAAFFQAFATALLAIACLLFIIYRRPTDVLVVLAPLLLAGLLTTATCVLIGQPFNFANIIALPLLMGIGVDSALHIHHRHTSRGGEGRPLLRTSTARAVLFSALTTAASFGNLALSPHAGTASMGLMLTVGLAMMLLTTLVVLPALLSGFVTRVERTP